MTGAAVSAATGAEVGSAVSGFTGAAVTGAVVTGAVVTGAAVAGVTGDDVGRGVGSAVAGVTGAGVSGVFGAGVGRGVGSAVAGVWGAGVASSVGGSVGSGSGASVAGVSGASVGSTAAGVGSTAAGVGSTAAGVASISGDIGAGVVDTAGVGDTPCALRWGRMGSAKRPACSTWFVRKRAAAERPGKWAIEDFMCFKTLEFGVLLSKPGSVDQHPPPFRVKPWRTGWVLNTTYMG